MELFAYSFSRVEIGDFVNGEQEQIAQCYFIYVERIGSCSPIG